jgi:hypothetical protein
MSVSAGRNEQEWAVIRAWARLIFMTRSVKIADYHALYDQAKITVKESKDSNSLPK